MTPLNGLATLALLVVGCLGMGCQAEGAEATGEGANPLDSGGPGAPSDESVCKSRDEIPPPLADAPTGGACPPVGSDCGDGLPVSLCNAGERRMALTCDTVTNTWRVSMKECAAADVAPSGGSPAATCKRRDEIPPPLALPAAGAGPDGVCVAEGTACDFPIALCTDGQGRRIYMECDKTTGAWRVVFKECP